MFLISFPASLLLVYSSMFFYIDFISYNFTNLIHLLILTVFGCTQGFLYVTLCFLTIVKSVSCSVECDSLQPHGLQAARLLCPRNSPGKNTGVGGHHLLQGIYPTQGSNLGLLHCRQILYLLNHDNRNNVNPSFLVWMPLFLFLA